MGEYFINILNMSYQAGIVICFILVGRFILGFLKGPKKYAYFLWVIPFTRMVIPFSFESILSLLPEESKPIRTDIVYMGTPEIYTGNAFVNEAVNQSLQGTIPGNSINPLQIWMFILQWIWLFGMVVLIMYSLISYKKLKVNLRSSLVLKENIFLADYIHTPFVLGIVKPRIFLPSDIKEIDMNYVLSHERVHIKRGDHIMKVAVFLITCVHWFNPLAWAAYILFCKDMEISCDEAVMKEYGEEDRRGYATTLLKLTVGKKRLAGVPLAFGEGNVKGRIKNIISYKRTTILAAITSIVLIAGLMIGLLTNPDEVGTNNQLLKKAVKDIPKDEERVYLNDIVPFQWTEVYTFDPYLSIEQQEQIIGFESNKLEESVSEEMVHLVFVKDKEVVGCVISHSETLGYDINLRIVDYMVLDINYIKVSHEQNAVFSVKQEEGLTRLDYLPEENPEKEDSVIPITTPILEKGMTIGADDPMLDYAGNNFVIFHGYFGLFVFSLDSMSMIGAIDLEAIGCQYTQGDNACEVTVSSDGTKVYLHPMSEDYMYVYEVFEQTLYKTTYSMEGIDKFDDFVDRKISGVDDGSYRIARMVEFKTENNFKHYGYLDSPDGTVDNIRYIEDDMIILLFSEDI